MTIRPVDMQTLIPKIPELQKARNAETEIEKNNLHINIQKEQLQQEKMTKQVIETEKNHGAKITREKENKKKKDKQEKNHKNNSSEDKDNQVEKSKGKALTRIDIRI